MRLVSEIKKSITIHSIVAVELEVTAKFTYLLWPRHIKAWNEISTFTIGQIMFYSRIFNSQAQLGTRDIQKLGFEKVVFTSKKAKIYDIWYVTRATHYFILWRVIKRRCQFDFSKGDRKIFWLVHLPSLHRHYYKFLLRKASPLKL